MLQNEEIERSLHNGRFRITGLDRITGSDSAMADKATFAGQAVRMLINRPLSIGTDCSGLDVPVLALVALRVTHEHIFSSDIDKIVKKQHRRSLRPKLWFDDLMKRNNKSSEAPAVDLYCAGFPCQPFSAAGKGRGFKDKRGRGKIFFGCADYIRHQRPKVFILENVHRLLHIHGGKTFASVMRTLRRIGPAAYDVQFEVLDTQHHGVPQSRRRVYIVGIRKDCQRAKISFPKPLLRAASLKNFLDPVEHAPTREDLPPETNMNARQNVQNILEQLTAQGHMPLTETFCIDHGSSPRRCGYMKDKLMCMTRSRPRGHWITSHGRVMNLDEMHRCQGMKRDRSKQVVTDRQMGALLGNAMSQNVLERLLCKVLPAAGLVDGLVDRWEIPMNARPVEVIDLRLLI